MEVECFIELQTVFVNSLLYWIQIRHSVLSMCIHWQKHLTQWSHTCYIPWHAKSFWSGPTWETSVQTWNAWLTQSLTCFNQGLPHVNRRHRVINEGTASHWKLVTSGVPQGFITGPILFLAYVSDIAEELSIDTSLPLYADDQSN